MNDGRSAADQSDVDGEFGAAFDPPVGSVLDPVMNSVTLLCCEAIAWVDEDWPGWVRVRLVDADGRVWFFVDKVPIFMDDDTRPGDPLPRPAFVRCIVVGKQEDQVLLVSTDPDHVEAEDGTTRFRVRPDQLQPDERDVIGPRTVSSGIALNYTPRSDILKSDGMPRVCLADRASPAAPYVGRATDTVT